MLYIFDSAEQLKTVLKNDGTACPYYDPVHSEKLTGDNTFTFSVPADHQDSQHVTESNLVAFKDLDANWQLFEIKRVTDIHGNGLTRTAFCEHAFYELIDDFIEDLRPTDCSAHFALTQALSGTRWEPGTVHDLGQNSTNYYYQSALAAVQKVAAVWKGELQFRVVVQGGVISNRYVDLLARRGADTGKQFTYGRHTRNIEREVDLTETKTALYGRGKGEAVESGGYGRRTTFATVEWSVTNGDPVDKPAGQEWVGDPDALAQWGRLGGRHRFGVYEDPEETDPTVLLQKTWEALQERKSPRVTYRLDVADLERLSGYEHEKVRLGDTVRVIDRKFNPALLVEARVIEIDRHLLRPEETKVTLGNFPPTLADDALKQQQIAQTVRDRQGVWDKATNFQPGEIPTSWLDGVIDVLTNQLRSTTSNWYTDENGNLVFETLDGTAAMMLTGNGFMLSNEKDANEQWIWRTFGTGDGFTADELNAGQINTSLIKIFGNSNFYWDGDYLYILNPDDQNQQIRLSKEGIRFTKDGGQSWSVAMDFNGLVMTGKSEDSYTKYVSEGVKHYNQADEMVAHLGTYEALGNQDLTFSRASVAYLPDGPSAPGAEVASGVPRYEPGYFHNLLSDTQAKQLNGAIVNGSDSGKVASVIDPLDGSIIFYVKEDLTGEAYSEIALSPLLYNGKNLTFSCNAKILAQADNVTKISIYTSDGYYSATQTTITGDGRFSVTRQVPARPDNTTRLRVGVYAGTKAGFKIKFSLFQAELRDYATPWILPSNGKAIRMEKGATNLMDGKPKATTHTRNGYNGWETLGTGNDTRNYLIREAAAIGTVIPVSASTRYTFSCIFYTDADASDPDNVGDIYFRFDGTGYPEGGVYIRLTNGGQVEKAFKTHLGGGWWLVIATFTTTADTTKITDFFFDVDVVDITSFLAHPFLAQTGTFGTYTPTTRNGDKLTVIPIEFLNAQQGTIEFKMLVDSKVHNDFNGWCMAFSISDLDSFNQLSLRKVTSSNNWALYSCSGTNIAASGSFNLSDGWHKVAVKWDKSIPQTKIIIDGVVMGTVNYVPDTFTNADGGGLYVGRWRSDVESSVFQFDSLICDFRISAIARSDEEIINSHLPENDKPLPVDRYTTYKLDFAQTLAPTVKKYGLYLDGGEITVNATVGGNSAADLETKTGAQAKVDNHDANESPHNLPSYAKMQSDGFKVYDDQDNLRCHMGQYETGKYGVKITNGKIFATSFQSGAEGADDYVKIGSAWSPLEVVLNGKTVLDIWAMTGWGGMIKFYDDTYDDMRGQISSYDDAIGQGLRIAGRDSVGYGMTVHIDALAVRIDGQYIHMDQISGDTDVTIWGDLHVTGQFSASGGKNALQKTASYGERYLYVRESPDVRYIIEGVAQFVNGECRIDIDPIFLECVEVNTEQTPWTFWFTPLFEPMNIYVSEIGDTYIIVREKDGVTNGQFCWKLSAIRKGYAGTWLPEKVIDDEGLLDTNWEDELLTDVDGEVV